MSRTLSVLVGVALLATSVEAQAIPKPLVSEVHHANVVELAQAAAAPHVPDGGVADESHAVRNGAIAGAVLGGIGGVVAAAALQVGAACRASLPIDNDNSCGGTAAKRKGMIELGLGGAITGTIIGSILGGVWSLIESF